MGNVDSRGQMASPARELEVFGEILGLLETFGRHLAYLELGGPLTDAQQAHLLFLFRTNVELRKLFLAERARQAELLPASPTQES